jgi:Co/Zn/Cd efflux system component
MSGCCASQDHGHGFEGLDPRYRRVLWLIIAINATLFVVEMLAGALAGSRALQADALDFLADSATYGLSLWAIGRSAPWRARTALLKAASLVVMGLWVLGSTGWTAFNPGLPRAEVMGSVGLLALAANLASVLLLLRWKDGDANVRSVWLCSRNDAIGNVAVLLAAVGVWGSATGWPDLVVAAGMAGLFLSSAWQILVRARRELAASPSAKRQAPPRPEAAGGA